LRRRQGEDEPHRQNEENDADSVSASSHCE
jgi:hypothetical protein